MATRAPDSPAGVPGAGRHPLTPAWPWRGAHFGAGVHGPGFYRPALPGESGKEGSATEVAGSGLSSVRSEAVVPLLQPKLSPRVPLREEQRTRGAMDLQEGWAARRAP